MHYYSDWKKWKNLKGGHKMVEEEKTQGDQKEETGENTGGGNNSERLGAVESADRAAQRLEEANKKTEELLRRQEDLYARTRLGGETDGKLEEKPKEETPQEYAKRISEGKA